MHTMTKRQGKSGAIDVKALLREDEEFLRALVRTALQEVLEAEMTEALGAEKGERALGRQGGNCGLYRLRGTGEVRPRGKPCCHRLQSGFQTFIELRHYLAASNAREQRTAIVEALQRAVATHGRGSAQLQ
jgi:hypothetical protein